MKPWDRDLMAKPQMRFVPRPMLTVGDDHILLQQGMLHWIVEAERAAAATPAAATAQTPGEPSTRIETSGLVYIERQRTTVAEPVARITRLFANGQTLSAQFALDVMTGGSPTGANPSGVAQTTASVSGTTTNSAADLIPTAKFKDVRGALDLDWSHPLGRVAPTLCGHVSREKDNQSFGDNAKMRRQPTSWTTPRSAMRSPVGGSTSRRVCCAMPGRSMAAAKSTRRTYCAHSSPAWVGRACAGGGPNSRCRRGWSSIWAGSTRNTPWIGPRPRWHGMHASRCS